jgi:O-antigen/teichoic acid export membrane protein
MAENLQKYTFRKAFVGAVSNIALNFYAIPLYGAKGAAISTIFSHGCASFIFNAFSARTRPIFFCQIKSFLFYRLFSKPVFI